MQPRLKFHQIPVAQRPEHIIECRFRTLEEVKTTALQLSLLCPEPAIAHYGLHELMLNAVEHGTLEIGFKKKAALVSNGDWLEEITRRLALPKYRNRKATAILRRTDQAVTVTISDEGKGFDWHPYIKLGDNPRRTHNGHGIYSALALSFSRLEYLAPGNRVVCTLKSS